MTQETHVKPALAIVKLDDVPGPEADTDTLNQHYQRVQQTFATHRYDDVIMACHWCCDSENDLVFAKPDKARGTRMFCSAHCANCFSAYEIKVWGRAAKPVSDERGQPDESTQRAEAPPKAKRQRSKSDPVDEADEPTTTNEDKGQEEKSTWKPAGKRERKPRKARAVKPTRTDGKCPKGFHEMTEANTYTYQDKTWCRECRKASRATSAAKRNGS